MVKETAKKRGRPVGSKNKPKIRATKEKEVVNYLGMDSNTVQAYRCARQGAASVASLKVYLGKVVDKKLWDYPFTLDEVNKALLNLQNRLERERQENESKGLGHN